MAAKAAATARRPFGLEGQSCERRLALRLSYPGAVDKAPSPNSHTGARANSPLARCSLHSPFG